MHHTPAGPAHGLVHPHAMHLDAPVLLRIPMPTATTGWIFGVAPIAQSTCVSTLATPPHSGPCPTAGPVLWRSARLEDLCAGFGPGWSCSPSSSCHCSPCFRHRPLPRKPRLAQRWAGSKWVGYVCSRPMNPMPVRRSASGTRGPGNGPSACRKPSIPAAAVVATASSARSSPPPPLPPASQPQSPAWSRPSNAVLVSNDRPRCLLITRCAHRSTGHC